MLNWFELEEYRLFRWLKENTPSFSSGNYGTLKLSNVAEVWKDRTDAQKKIEKYLSEYLCQLIFSWTRDCIEPPRSLHHHVHIRSAGQREDRPGSRSRHVTRKVSSWILTLRTCCQLSTRRSLLIDCGPIMRLKGSDSKIVAELARQTGYWPVFTFFNSMSNMIDLASVGLIGQKGSTCVYRILKTADSELL